MSAYKLLEKLVDVGDFIGVEGELFVTHKGELTLFVQRYTFLAKAIQPLGDKFHGIGDDQEKAYRQRYLDMILPLKSVVLAKGKNDMTTKRKITPWVKIFDSILVYEVYLYTS